MHGFLLLMIPDIQGDWTLSKRPATALCGSGVSIHLGCLRFAQGIDFTG